MNPLLKLDSVSVLNTKGYRIKNVSISIREGEKVALLGKSGSGKTTLIKVANGLIKPDSGSVKYDGIKLKELSRRKKVEIGTLWQDLRLLESLSVGQNINVGALGKNNLIWSIKNLICLIDKKKCISSMKLANLPIKIINTPLENLSGGQKQRVAFARLLRQEAKINLADEPLSSLDPRLSTEIIKTILREADNSLINVANTCLVSLHRPDMINGFTRIIAIKNGNVIIDKENKNKLSSKDIDLIYS